MKAGEDMTGVLNGAPGTSAVAVVSIRLMRVCTPVRVQVHKPVFEAVTVCVSDTLDAEMAAWGEREEDCDEGR